MKIGPRTNLAVEFERQKYSYFFDNGFPAEREFLRLPRDRFLLGEPDFNDAEFISNSFTYNIEHQFSDNLKFRQGFNALLSTGETRSAFFGDLESDRRTLPRDAFRSDEEQENYTLQNEFSAEFNTGSLQHKLLFGVELARFIYDFTFFSTPLASIDILDPVYGASPGEFGSGDRTRYGADNLGIYIQDLVEISPNLKLLAGVRFDSNDSFRENFDEEAVDNEQTDSDFSPRVGIVYQPSENTSLYASWSRSFAPQFFGRSRTNEVFQPVTGEQFEVGIKQAFLDERLSATLAFYQLTRQNVLTRDPDDPTNTFSIQTGEQRSRGIELDVAGEIISGWNIIATYAYTDAVVTEDNTIPVGDQLDGTPQHSASLWTIYEIQSGSLQGLGFGLGLVFVGEREARLPNTLELPSYFRTDASIFYRFNNYRIGLNIKNLFNTKYFESIENFSIFPGAPTTVLGSIAVEF